MAEILEQQKSLYLAEHGSPMTPEQEKKNYNILLSLQGLYFSDKESVQHFGSDPKYWESISDGLHCSVSAEDFGKRLEELRQDSTSSNISTSEKLAEACSRIQEQGFAVLENSDISERKKTAQSKIWKTVKSLEKHGWPAAFVFLYDEFWFFYVDPMFDVYNTLLNDNKCIMEPDLNCWSLKPSVSQNDGTSSNYIGKNFGQSHRDMKYNMCHDVDTEKYNSLNAWVPMNPSGASAMNGAMRVIPIDYDDFHYDSNHLYHMNTKKALGFMEDDVLEKEATKVLKANVGSLCTWVPSLIHWGGACCEKTILDKENIEPRMSFAATFRKSTAPRSQYGASQNESSDLTEGPLPIGREDMNTLDIGKRLSYVAKALISYAHWYPGFPGLSMNRLSKGCTR